MKFYDRRICSRVVLFVLIAVLGLAAAFRQPVHAAQPGSLDIDIDKNGIATITGETTGTATFTGLYIDGSVKIQSLSGKSFKTTYDTKKQSIGYHSLSAELSDGTEIYFDRVFPVSIYDVPNLTAKCFETEPKSLVFTAPLHNGTYFDYNLMMIKKGQSWDKAKIYGPFSPLTPTAIKGLTPGTTYQFRAVLVRETTYGGNTYYMTSPKSSVVTVKTGPKKKPVIQSVKVSKAKVKKVWVKPLVNALGVVIQKGFYAYETTYTVTISFKKKPGIAGLEIYAGGVTLPKYLKGNKKTYKTKFTIGGKAVGTRTKFKIRTKGNKNYGAWSNFTTVKKVKISK